MSRLRLLDVNRQTAEMRRGARSGSRTCCFFGEEEAGSAEASPSGRAAPKPRNGRAAYRDGTRTARHLAPVSDHRGASCISTRIAGYSNCDCRQRRTNPTPPARPDRLWGDWRLGRNPNRAPALLVRPAPPVPALFASHDRSARILEGFIEVKPYRAVRGAPSTDGEDNDSAGNGPLRQPRISRLRLSQNRRLGRRDGRAAAMGAARRRAERCRERVSPRRSTGATVPPAPRKGGTGAQTPREPPCNLDCNSVNEI